MSSPSLTGNALVIKSLIMDGDSDIDLTEPWLTLTLSHDDGVLGEWFWCHQPHQRDLLLGVINTWNSQLTWVINQGQWRNPVSWYWIDFADFSHQDKLDVVEIEDWVDKDKIPLSLIFMNRNWIWFIGTNLSWVNAQVSSFVNYCHNPTIISLMNPQHVSRYQLCGVSTLMILQCVSLHQHHWPDMLS